MAAQSSSLGRRARFMSARPPNSSRPFSAQAISSKAALQRSSRARDAPPASASVLPSDRNGCVSIRPRAPKGSSRVSARSSIAAPRCRSSSIAASSRSLLSCRTRHRIRFRGGRAMRCASAGSPKASSCWMSGLGDGAPLAHIRRRHPSPPARGRASPAAFGPVPRLLRRPARLPVLGQPAFRVADGALWPPAHARALRAGIHGSLLSPHHPANAPRRGGDPRPLPRAGLRHRLSYRASAAPAATLVPASASLPAHGQQCRPRLWLDHDPGAAGRHQYALSRPWYLRCASTAALQLRGCCLRAHDDPPALYDHLDHKQPRGHGAAVSRGGAIPRRQSVPRLHSRDPPAFEPRHRLRDAARLSLDHERLCHGDPARRASRQDPGQPRLRLRDGIRMAARGGSRLRAAPTGTGDRRAHPSRSAAGPRAGPWMSRSANILIVLLAAISYLLILGPILLVVVTAFSPTDFFAFPPRGISLRWFETFFATEELRSAFWLSLELALAAATLATVAGTLAALAVARRRGVIAGILQGLFLAPLVFPTIILGLALLLFYKVIGGVPIFLGLLIAHTVVGAPFAIRSILASLQTFDPALAEAGQSLGAGPLRTFFLVTLPIIWPGIVSGWMFAFIVSFGELNTALFLTGPGVTTLPIEIFSYLQFQGGQLVIAAASAVQVALIVAIVFAVERVVGLARLVRSE